MNAELFTPSRAKHEYMWPRIVGVGGNNASLFPLQVVYGEDVKVVLRGIEGIEGQSRVESVAHGRVIMAEAAPPPRSGERSLAV